MLLTITTGIPFTNTEPGGPQNWLFDKGRKARDRTGGGYDIVVWHARGKGVASNKTGLTMYVRAVNLPITTPG